MADYLGFVVDRTIDEKGRVRDSQAPGFLVCAYESERDGMSMADIVYEEFGIESKVEIDCFPLPQETPDDPVASHMIIKGAQAVLRALPGDAVLLFNGESIDLLKKDGVLYVNSIGGWPDYSIFQQPYVLKAFDHL